jgi:hypothetical protein
MAFDAREAVSMRPIERHEMVLVMTPRHRLSRLDVIPLKELRREPMVALSPGVNNTLAVALDKWLAGHIGEAPKVIANEPPDQIAGAVAHRGNAVALLTVARASAAAGMGLVYRRLAPSPILVYGAAYRNDNRSPVLANLLETVDRLATPLETLTTDYETLSES